MAFTRIGNENIKEATSLIVNSTKSCGFVIDFTGDYHEKFVLRIDKFKYDCKNIKDEKPEDRLKCEGLSTLANTKHRFFVNMIKSTSAKPEETKLTLDGKSMFPTLPAAEFQVGFVFGRQKGKNHNCTS